MITPKTKKKFIIIGGIFFVLILSVFIFFQDISKKEMIKEFVASKESNSNITCTETEFTKTIDVNSEYDSFDDYTDMKLGGGYFEIVQRKSEISAISDVRCDNGETIFQFNLEDIHKVIFEKNVVYANADCNRYYGQNERKEIYDVGYVKTVCTWQEPIDIIFIEKDALKNKNVYENTVFSKPDLFCEQISNEIYKEKCYRAAVAQALNDNDFVNREISVTPYPFLDDGGQEYMIDIFYSDENTISLFKDYLKNDFLKRTNRGVPRESNAGFYYNDNNYHFGVNLNDVRSDISNLFYFYFKTMEFRNKDIQIIFSLF